MIVAPTSWVVRELTPGEFVALERRFGIQLDATARAKLQAAMECSQEAQMIAAAAVRSSNVRPVLEEFYRSLSSAEEWVKRLLAYSDRSPEHVAVQSIRYAGAIAGQGTSTESLKQLRASLRATMSDTKSAVKKLPGRNLGAPFRNPGLAELGMVAGEIFVDGGGAPAAKTAFLEAVGHLAGYEHMPTRESLKRKPDKEKRRRKQLGKNRAT